MRRLALALALVVGLTAVAFAKAPPAPPKPTRWVTDNAGLLAATEREQLDDRLEKYERATGRQVIVWIGTTLDGEPIEDWSVRAFAAWKIGEKKLDNGVAVFLFATDHLVRIEVGYGVEDRLPDIYASRIIREQIAPALKAGHPAAGLTAAIDEITKRLDSVPDAHAERVRDGPQHTSTGVSLGTLILGGIIGLFLLGLAITHPRMALWLLWNVISSLGRGGGGGGGYSGGGGGGGGGGFSGGGGRSGGGGASGSW